jgi:hypothetical protein
MSAFKLFAALLTFSLSLFAQQIPPRQLQPRQRHLGADEWAVDTVPAVMAYCDAVDRFSAQEQPRIFARLKTNSTTEFNTGEWKEFSGKDEWEAADKPAPLVFAWDKNGTTIKVAVIAKPPVAWRPFGTYRRIEYCYGPDAKLVRVRAISYVPTRCEFLFPCRLIAGHEFFLMQGPGTTDWVFTADGQIHKLWNGKEHDDYFDPSHSLTVNDLHLKTSDDLPFNRPTSR